MRVCARSIDRVQVSAAVEPYTRQRFVTAGKEYDVHAIQVYEGITFVQFIDDIGYPAWQPSALFDVVDTSIPVDWHCNIFHRGECAEVLAAGPDFLVKDYTALTEMIQLDADQVDRFWRRGDALTAPADGA